jgi:cytochrome c-type biogenesis protein CcmF
MEDIQYIGEHLLPGQFGHAALVASFVASILTALAYYFATQNRANDTFENWRKIGRVAFTVHGLGIFSVIGVMFYVMTQQYYEYQYVQAHVSDDLPFKYIFSAFWEGQEGSFLLWMFWHIVLGFILILTAKRWEAPVMSTLATIQLFIGSMILGLYFGVGDYVTKIGSNPLLLLRDTMDAPIFANADYVSLLKGTGLNPLLQNYWMTIHPPTLFLGFASTAIPFCFAVAGLWTKEHKAWLKPALSWSLFSAAILGTGILMGGAWAYEALSFGGYWAWDPVENMSLVPWLLLLAGVHTHLVAKSTGHSVRATYVFYLLTFIFIVYSTFLTRSGVLGDTSVHAFTEMGLEWQLVAFIVFYLGLSAYLLFRDYKGIPSPAKEEDAGSREFWMFIGSLVLLFSALIITASTSLPVYNKIMQFFNPAFEGYVITEPEPHYNKYQLWIGVFIGLLTGSAQYLRYREINFKGHSRKFILHMGIAIGLSAILTYITTFWIEAKAWQYLVLLFCGLFAIVSNLDYLITFVRGQMKMAGSVIAHVGFGLMIVGILASGLNKQFISTNPFAMDGLIEGADEERLRNNILLFKDSPMIMQGYEVTYVSDTLDTYTRTYTVNYKKKDKEGNVDEEFNLYPNVLYDKSFTKIAASNPSTKRYANRDIFTHIASLPQVEIDMEFRRAREDSLNYKSFLLDPGASLNFIDTVPIVDQDTFSLNYFTAAVADIIRNPTHPDYVPETGDIAIGARIGVQRSDIDSMYWVEPVLVLRGQLLYSFPVQINEISSRVRLTDQIFDQVFTPEDQLEYNDFTFKQGDKIFYNGYDIEFIGFNKEPEHPNYQREDNDIAVSAMIRVTGDEGQSQVVQPVYLIRGNRPFNLKDEIPAIGLHVRFTGLDPNTETVEIKLAQKQKVDTKIPFEVATNSLRSDYIVLEAIEFPGINFFWLGSVLMMLGLGFSTWVRIREKA